MNSINRSVTVPPSFILFTHCTAPQTQSLMCVRWQCVGSSVPVFVRHLLFPSTSLWREPRHFIPHPLVFVGTLRYAYIWYYWKNHCTFLVFVILVWHHLPPISISHLLMNGSLIEHKIYFVWLLLGLFCIRILKILFHFFLVSIVVSENIINSLLLHLYCPIINKENKREMQQTISLFSYHC